MSVLGSIGLGAATSFASNLVGSIFGNNSAKKQYEYQRKLNQEAFQHDIDMWNRQNEYNTPSAQMERLQAAGLNPNLVYGNGGATNTASGAPTYNAGHAPDVASARQAASSIAMQGFNTGLNAMLQQAQIRNINADTGLKDTQNQLTGVQKEISMLDKELKSGTLSSEMQYKIEKWKQDLVLGRNQIRLGEQQFTLNQKEMERLDAQTGNIVANTKLTESQAQQIAIIIDYLPETLRSQISANNANAYNAVQSGNLSGEKVNTEKSVQRVNFSQAAVNDVTKALKITENSLKHATFNDVVSNEHFKALDAQKQFEILCKFGIVKAQREAYGADGAMHGVGTFITSGAMNLDKVVGDIWTEIKSWF